MTAAQQLQASLGHLMKMVRILNTGEHVLDQDERAQLTEAEMFLENLGINYMPEATAEYEVIVPDRHRDGQWRQLEVYPGHSGALRYAQETWGADEDGRIEIVNSQGDDEGGRRWYVTIPDPDQGPGVWHDVDNFGSRAEALALAKQTFGADEDGRISIVRALAEETAGVPT